MKAARTIVSVTEAVWEPLVPLAVKLRGLVVVAERLPTVSVLLCPGLIDVGLNVQAAPEPIVQANVMLLIKLLVADAEILKVVDVVPTVIVEEVAVAESENSAMPLPARATVCGEPVALSVMLKLPVRLALPAPVGLKMMLNVQLAPGLRVAGLVELGAPALQVSVWLKSPVTEILVILRAELPLLVSVTD